MEKPHYNVIIATPGNSLELFYVSSLTKTLTELNKRNISYIWLGSYVPIVNLAREHTLDGGYLFDHSDEDIDFFTKGPIRDSVTYDKIFLIDSDIAWEPDQFLKLYYSDLDIISGIYMDALGRCTTDPQNMEDLAGRSINDIDEVIEANSFGFGFVCVKSGIFEKLKRPWFQFLYSEKLKDSDEDVRIMFGEDISWCIRVKELGYKIYSDYGVKVQHIKKIVLG